MPDPSNRFIATFSTMIDGDNYVLTRRRPPGYSDHKRSTWDVRRVDHSTPRHLTIEARVDEDPHTLAEIALEEIWVIDREESEAFQELSAKAYRVLRAELTGDLTHTCDRDFIDVYTAFGVSHLLGSGSRYAQGAL